MNLETQFKYALKRTLPARGLKLALKVRARVRALWAWEKVQDEPLEDQCPWCSPDVWQQIVDAYADLPNPVVFEYGSGVSSIWHIRNLMKAGGTYVSVEHDHDWYTRVIQAVVSDSLGRGLTVTSTIQPVSPDVYSRITACDALIRLETAGSAGCTAVLKFRAARDYGDEEGDGAFSQFREYVTTLDQQCDVVVVDGRARKACINHVLDTSLLKPGGLLALLEAGRGHEGWLGSPALSGTSNYQPEVHRMLKLGGQLVDGCGMDLWPGLKRRRSSSRTAYRYAMEACFLRIPAVSANAGRVGE